MKLEEKIMDCWSICNDLTDSSTSSSVNGEFIMSVSLTSDDTDERLERVCSSYTNGSLNNYSASMRRCNRGDEQ
jgi:hypothetical protein